MTSERLLYDRCAYSHKLREDAGMLGYVMDPCRYHNDNKARIEFGIMGGTTVSHIEGNLVDLESDLRGITRINSKCPTFQYQNPCATSNNMAACQRPDILIRDSPKTKGRVIRTAPIHLNSAQMFTYNPIPLPPTYG
jgi:hypothetical protein